ncbi:MAG: DNA repair protein RecN [Bacteroidales bacterium]|nr:DNA repair protein RecN [Bacteroidales bacterium]
MLKRLYISNFALIDSVEIEFPNGLIIISGETGAGKSILLGGLSLLLGGKSDSSSLLDKERNCIVEGTFSIENQPTLLKEICTVLECDNLPGNELLVRRVISPNGRSRSFINDIPVQLAVLSQITLKLIDIHAQHATLRLNDKDYQMSVLDYYCGAEKELEAYREANGLLSKKYAELKEVKERAAANERNMDYISYRLEKLQEAALKEGELERLEEEQKQLSTAEEYKNDLCASIGMLSANADRSFVQNLKDISHLLNRHTDAHPKLAELSERFESIRIELKDLESDLQDEAERVVISPARLQDVEERLNTLYSLMKKHGVNSIEELIEERNRLQGEIEISNNATQKIEEIEAEVEVLRKKREICAAELSAKRKSAADKLGDVLQERIRRLEMQDAIFTVSLCPADDYEHNGKDKVEFLFSANKGIAPAPVQKAASGGELSRLMLCIKWLMAKYTGMPTMIFDEIDTGVSGRIADKMGALIDEMGRNMQIFSITHLPQIASKGDTHILVYKETDAEQTKSKLKILTPQERVMEIARMLSGEVLSEAAIENAKYLLKNKI